MDLPPGWADFIGQYLDHLQLACFSRGSIRLRAYQLGHLAVTVGVGAASVTATDIAAWLESRPWAPATRRSHRAAASGFFRWAHSQGLVARNPLDSVPTARAPRHVPKPCPDQAVHVALRRADERAALMIELARCHGLRRGEIAAVHSDDLIETGRGQLSLVVHGKGGSDRIIPLAPWMAAKLLARGPGWLFPARHGGHVSPDWVGRLLSQALPRPWTAHTLRHRFATDTYRYSRDIAAVQRLLGHVRIESTVGYIAVADEELRAAIAWTDGWHAGRELGISS
jgi:integrase